MSKSVNSIEYDKFRELLKLARIKAGVSQIELAKALDQPQSVISKIERGERRIDVVEFVKIVHTLGLDPTQILQEFIDSLA